MDETLPTGYEVLTLGDPTPAVLLHVIAEAFNKLSILGERVDIRFNSVMTNYGYVLQDQDGSWGAKLKVGEPPTWWLTHDRQDPDDH